MMYLPADIAGSAQLAMLAAPFDGVQTISAYQHAYLPAEWLGSEFPKCTVICDAAAAHRARCETGQTEDPL
jgi:hypothetical protein